MACAGPAHRYPQGAVMRRDAQEFPHGHIRQPSHGSHSRLCRLRVRSLRLLHCARGVPSLEDLTPDPQAVQRAKDYFLTVAPGDREILEAMASSLNPRERYQVQRQIGVAAEAATQLCLELPHAH